MKLRGCEKLARTARTVVPRLDGVTVVAKRINAEPVNTLVLEYVDSDGSGFVCEYDLLDYHDLSILGIPYKTPDPAEVAFHKAKERLGEMVGLAYVTVQGRDYLVDPDISVSRLLVDDDDPPSDASRPRLLTDDIGGVDAAPIDAHKPRRRGDERSRYRSAITKNMSHKKRRNHGSARS